MKYLVTGGGGFIGSHLVDRLLTDGHQVIVVDDFSEGKWENLQQHHLNIFIYKRSILDDIGDLFKGVDVVFHLAASTRPQVSIKNPEETTLVNVQGTLRILEHCHKHKVKRLVFVSSSSLYGEQDILPTPETAEPKPISPYALTKLVGEQYCELYRRMYGMEFNAIRPFNVYGKRQNPKGGYAAAVPKFIELLGKDETPWITGDGKQTRDFVYVGDVVELMVLASKSKVVGEAFNAASGKNVSINDLYNKIANLMDKYIKADHVAEVLEPRITLGDISKAKKLLGWEPKVDLEEGLRRTTK